MRIPKISKAHTFLIMMISFLLCCSRQVHAAQSEVYTYIVTDGKAQITKYTGACGDITVPSTLDGFSVNKYGQKGSWQSQNFKGMEFDVWIRN